MTQVLGEVLLPAAAPRGAAARVLVEVRDVTVADAASVVVGSTVLEDVSVEPGGRVPFVVDVPEPAPGRDLALRVHVDVNGSGRVEAGDLLSTAVHPVAGPSARSVVEGDRFVVPVVAV